MWDTAAITALCILAYTAVILLCPTVPVTLGHGVAGGEYVGRHKVVGSVEEELTEMFIEAWLKGEERWLRYAWIEEWPETVSWNVS